MYAKLFASVLLILPFCTPAQAGQPDIDRFKREYPVAFGKTKSILHASAISGVLKRSDRKSERLYDVTCYRSHGLTKLIRVQRGAKEATETVYCLGKDRTYMIRLDQHSRTYLVKETGNDRDSVEMSLINFYSKFFDSGISLYGVEMAEIMKEPTFKILSAEPDVQSGKNLLRVTFEVGNPIKALSIVTFDTDSDWMICESEYRPGNLPNSLIKATVQKHIKKGDWYVPTEISFRDIDGVVWQAEVQDIKIGPIPEEQFSPVHYGLPEEIGKPSPIRQHENMYYMIGLFVVGVVVIMSLLARAILRRPAATAM